MRYIACVRFSAGQIWSFIANYKNIFIPIFTIFGLFECFFGFKLLKPSFFIVGTGVSFFLILVTLIQVKTIILFSLYSSLFL